MPPAQTDSLIHRLTILRRKADMQATAHAWLHDFYGNQNSLLTLVSLISGVILVALVLVTPGFVQESTGLPQQAYSVLVAGLAIAEFSIVVALLAWRPDVKASDHNRAVQYFSRWTHTFTDAMLAPERLTAEKVTQLEQRYLEEEDLPRIPEARFLELKRWYLLKVQISQELDKNPNESIRRIRTRLEKANQSRPDPDAMDES
jgi:hypothetical protein